MTIPLTAGARDFFGLKDCTTEVTRFDPRAWGGLMGGSRFPPQAATSLHGFLASVPAGFARALAWGRRLNMPITITENGTEDAGDDFRPGHLREHRPCLWIAITKGTRVLGYLHRALVDTFRWAEGLDLRFGLWVLAPLSQACTRRRSADLFVESCRTNRLSTDLVGSVGPRGFECIPRWAPGTGTSGGRRATG